nr:hypothetical protein [Tanacetum cinerariifolium]
APPSPDYIPGPEEPEQAPPSPDYVPGPEHANDEIGSSEDDDMDIEADEEEEEEHLDPADFVVVALIAADQAPSTEETEPFETEAASTSHSPSLPPPFILSPTRLNAPSSGIPLLLPISASTSSPPLQLPFASRREDRPEVTLPPRKRLAGGLRADYSFVATMDREIMRDLEREGAPVSTDTELGGYMREFELGDRRAHAYTRHLMETEARLSREVGVRSTEASDLVRGPEHADDEIVAKDKPYAEDASPTAQSPENVPESDLEAHPEDDDDEEDPVDCPTDGGDDGDDEEGPIRSLGYRAAMIRLRAEAASTSHSPPLPSPFILSPTRSDTPSSGTPLLLPISASTSSPPLQLPSASRREDRPELLAGRLNMLFRDRRAHAYTSHLMETEARLSREAWVRSTDASDLVRGEVMSLRTTILGQMIEIRELHVADRRRQIVISELPRADYRRSTEIIELRTAL